MALDLYAPCPCGSGKKIKFCCADLSVEIDKITRMLEGDQRAGCLEYIKQAERKHPDQPALLGFLATVEMELDRWEDAKETVGRFVTKHPANPIALACQALLLSASTSGRAAVEPLQKAIAGAGDDLSEQVFEAFGSVGMALLAEGEILAARLHLLLHACMSDEKDTRSLDMLMQVGLDGDVPILLKEEMNLATCAEDAQWKKAFDEAADKAMQGNWRDAAARLEALRERSAGAPEVWKNLGMLYAWQADNDRAVAALRTYASLDVPVDEAAEAEALALLLDRESDASGIDLVRITYPVNDVDALQDQLVADRHAVKARYERGDDEPEDQPPPLCVYLLLDRPLPESGVNLAIEDLPSEAGKIFLFGHQTDRPAQLELLAYRTSQFDATLARLADVAGGQLGSAVDEQVEASVPATVQMFQQKRLFPADTPADRRRTLLHECYRDILFVQWPDSPSPQLDGKSPREAARDEHLLPRVLAQILLLETNPRSYRELDANELRRQLGLAELAPIDPAEVDLATLPLVRLGRLVVEKLSDDMLVRLFRRAERVQAAIALRRFGAEIVRRGDRLPASRERAMAYGVVAGQETDLDATLTLVQQARRIAESVGLSSGQWELWELKIRIQQQDIDAIRTLISHLQAAHKNEPAIMQGLVTLLVSAGILGPDGRPAQPAAATETSQIIVPGAGASAEGGIWTPDQEPASEKKTSLWTPD